MIVKNEEETLARCLDSVKAAVDEIVIVDTGSADRTREIAARYTDKIYDFPWRDDFSAARNFSFGRASCDYLFWLDADDILPPQELEKLLTLKETLPPGAAMVMMKYHTAFDADGNPTFTYERERLMRRSLRPLWTGAIHEAVGLMEPLIHADIAVHHNKLHTADPGRNLRIFESMIASGRILTPREQYYYGRELYYHGNDEKALEVLEAFLSDGSGWRQNRRDACRDTARIYRARNETERALTALFRSFLFSRPCAETLCDIGELLMQRGQYEAAVFWYTSAAAQEPDTAGGGFIAPDSYGYIPYMQLCVCYSRLGDPVLAQAYNEKAGALKPRDPSYLYNKNKFDEARQAAETAGDAHAGS
jgi:glycosyltransferase involved in cell wall biosynthesis